MLIQLIAVQVVTFFALVFVLRKLLYTESVKETARLKTLKREITFRQSELQQKIDAAEKKHDEMVAMAEREIAKMRARAEKESETLKQKTLTGAKEEAEKILNSALNSREKIKDEAELETRKKLPAMVKRIFVEILSPAARESIHKEMTGQISDVLKNMPGERFYDGHGGRVCVQTAFTLSDSEKKRISGIISEKTNAETFLEESENKELLAGMVIEIGTLTLDGSLENRLREVLKKSGE
ncbi:MAG: F0F1 ATP synthase subunit delta [Candidatus Omnitrophota bacterium]